MRTESEKRGLVAELRLQGAVLLGLVGAMWVLELVDLLALGGSLDGLGIRPRQLEGLVGIPLAPFLHGGLGHLAANSVPLLVFGWLVMLRETWHLAVISAVVVLAGGLGVWLLGRPLSVHIGASGLVFGLFGHLLLTGWFERRAGSVLLSLLVLVAYGGILFGVLPGQPGISWEAHLFGFLAGVLSARILARRAGSDGAGRKRVSARA